MANLFQRPRHLRLSIATFLSVALAVLVALPTGLVTAIGLGTALSNTGRLLDERSQLFRAAMVARSYAYLGPAEAAAGFLARRIGAGELDHSDPGAVGQALQYAFAAAPQLSAVSYVSDAGWLVAAYRRPTGEYGVDRRSWRTDPTLEAAVADSQKRGPEPRWERPVFIPNADMTLLRFTEPVMVGGAHVGLVVVSVRLDELSRFVEDLAGPWRQQFGAQPFILYDRDYVIGHPRLLRPDGLLTAFRPLPLVDEVGDPVLGAIWRPGDRARLRFATGPGHVLDVDGQRYAFFYEPLNLPSDAPWLVGGYIPVDGLSAELYRLVAAGVVALLALAAAVATAVLLARRLSRPVTALAVASERVAALALDEVPALPRSPLAEVDAAVRAFNGMVGALRLLLRYAPTKLAAALIERGEEATRSERRVVTVMFTDIVGFTAAAELMSAEDAAALLNAHHTRVIACVEAEGGTVDKLIGDGLLAFWGAPEHQPDHADRAVRAALAVRAAITAANRYAETPVRVRVGLHTGPAVVGNIGGPSRLSYTIVGDTVNVASRVEEQNRALQPDAEVGLMLSAAVAEALTGGARLVPMGEHRIRGRAAGVRLFTLATDP